jgi:ubiquinol-cytochrome c reductase iron-sulfur subunit
MTAKSKASGGPSDHGGDGETRRDFLQLTGAAFGAVGAACVAAPLINSLNPAKDTLALATVEIDISQIPVGEARTVMWQGKPVFVRHRTPEEIKQAQDVDVTSLPDKEGDDKRVKKAEWLIVVGICTHLGCVPVGQKSTEERGEYDGWFCPCPSGVHAHAEGIRRIPDPA